MSIRQTQVPKPPTFVPPQIDDNSDVMKHVTEFFQIQTRYQSQYLYAILFNVSATRREEIEEEKSTEIFEYLKSNKKLHNLLVKQFEKYPGSKSDDLQLSLNPIKEDFTLSKRICDLHFPFNPNLLSKRVCNLSTLNPNLVSRRICNLSTLNPNPLSNRIQIESKSGIKYNPNPLSNRIQIESKSAQNFSHKLVTS